MPTWILLLVACKDTPTDTAPPAVDCSTRPIGLPSARGEVSGVWDEARGRLVFFGGDEGTPVDCTSRTDFVGETWAFATDCDNFEPLAVDAGPPARGRHATALDAERGWMIVHGGRFRDGTSGTYTLYDDTWALDLATDTWTQLGEEGPGERTNHTAVVSGGRYIVFGGNESRDGASFRPLGDTWALDLDTRTWTELDTTGDDPGERLFHAAALSADGGTMYVYGGGDERAFTGPFFGDLFALDLATNTWTELHDGRGDAPNPRIWPGLHAVDGGLLLWAGHDDGALGNTNELWRFDLGSGAWTQLSEGDVINAGANGFCDFPADFVTPDLSAPERRNAGVSAITGAGELIVFGGKTDCGLINDVWTWDPGSGAWTSRSKATTGEICERAFAECSTMCY